MITLIFKNGSKKVLNRKEWLDFLNTEDIHYTTGDDPIMEQKWKDVYKKFDIEKEEWEYNPDQD